MIEKKNLRVSIICIIVLIFCKNSCAKKHEEVNPETTEDIIRTLHTSTFHQISYQVTTEDKYILTLHRLNLNTSAPNIAPIFFQHGLFGSSSDWLINDRDKSLAVQLAEKGYDIWFGNVRGNGYSRKNETLQENSMEFWNFSFHEMGTKDLPAMIDFILKTTNSEKLYYIGHSMGTTMFYILCSMLPEYNKKIITMISLSPVAFMSHVSAKLATKMASYMSSLEKCSNYFEIRNLPSSKISDMALRVVNVDRSKNMILEFGGVDDEQLDSNLVKKILDHSSFGIATPKILLHYGQEIKSGKFRQYDYGEATNRQKYNSPEPPPYNLKNITAPVYLVVGVNDYLANLTDVKLLADNLPNLLGVHRSGYVCFNHIDYIWGKEVTKEVNDHLNTVIDDIQSNIEEAREKYKPNIQEIFQVDSDSDSDQSSDPCRKKADKLNLKEKLQKAWEKHGKKHQTTDNGISSVEDSQNDETDSQSDSSVQASSTLTDSTSKPAGL